MRTLFVRSLWLSLSLVLVLCAAFRTLGIRRQGQAKAKDKDNPQSPIEVYEWSIWVGNPAQTSFNTARIYKNAMPSVGRHEPAEVRRQGAGRQVPDRPDLGRAVLRRAVQGCGRRPAGEEGPLPLALAGEHRARRPAPVVQVGPVRESAREHPAELSARRPLARRSCATTTRPCSSSTSRISSGSSPTTPSWRSRSRSRSGAVPMNTPCRT